MFWKKKEQDPKQKAARRGVLQLLGELMAEHAFVTVQVGDHRQEHTATSLLIDIDHDSDAVVLDMLTPQTVDAHVQPEQKVTLRGKHQGIRWHFDSHFIRSEIRGSDRVHLVALPEEITYKQQRESYRLSIRPSLRTIVAMRRQNGQLLTGKILDLSTSGLRVGINGLPEDPPATGELLVGGRLTMPDTPAVSFTAEVRYHNFDRDRRLMIIGLKFRELEGAQERNLARFILEGQREEKRNRIETD